MLELIGAPLISNCALAYKMASSKSLTVNAGVAGSITIFVKEDSIALTTSPHSSPKSEIKISSGLLGSSLGKL